jgi:hypothetical protein
MSAVSVYVQIRAEIAKRLRLSVPKAIQVVEHGGPITLEELKRVATRAPALVVACLGVPSITREGMQVTTDAAYAVFCVAAKSPSETQGDIALALVSLASLDIPGQRWNQAASGVPQQIAATNLYSSALDKVGLALWAIRWRQKVDLDRTALMAALEPFETFVGEYDVATAGITAPINDPDDTETTTDQTELPQ